MGIFHFSHNHMTNMKYMSAIYAKKLFVENFVLNLF